MISDIGNRLVHHLNGRVPRSVRDTFRKAYSKYIRPHLPAKDDERVLTNGVLVSRQDAKILDSIIGDPTYEYFNVRELRERVRAGDTVAIVGGGMGVTAVVAARQVGPGGSVHVYEAGQETYEQLNQTVTRNGVDDIVESYHAIVGEPGAKLRSDAGGPETIGGSDLPPVDVLEIDCEGAETDVLGAIDTLPETVTVEGHTHYGVSPEELILLFNEKGYEIIEWGGDPEMVYHLVGVRR